MDRDIKEVMDLKNKQVRKAMDAKEKSMAIIAAGRDATLIMSELVKSRDYPIIDTDSRQISEDAIKDKLKEWRNWFYYEIYTRDPDEDIKREAEPFEVNLWPR